MSDLTQYAAGNSGDDNQDGRTSEIEVLKTRKVRITEKLRERSKNAGNLENRASGKTKIEVWS